MKRSYILMPLLFLALVSFGGVVKGGVDFGEKPECKGKSTCKADVSTSSMAPAGYEYDTETMTLSMSIDQEVADNNPEIFTRNGGKLQFQQTEDLDVGLALSRKLGSDATLTIVAGFHPVKVTETGYTIQYHVVEK